MIINEVKNLFNQTIEYYNKTKYDIRLNIIWSNNKRDIENILNTSSSVEELVDKVDQTFMYSINFPPENGQHTGLWVRDGDTPHVREKQIDWLLDKQNRSGVDIFSMPENIQESSFIHSRNKVIRNNRILSGNFLRTLSISQQIFRNVGHNFSNVLELGGGCGHQARTILLQKDCKYTIIDLPETLIFSYAFIRLNFPEKNVLWVTKDEDFNRIDEYHFIVIPAVFADKLIGREYDLFINTASMGEMRNEVIHYWMDLIQNKIKIKNLFTLNRYFNTVDNNHIPLRINENECSTSYDRKWEIINWELEPVYCRCPYIDTLHSRYVEIIANRLEEEPDNEWCVKKSNELLQEVHDEDWWRLQGFYNDGVMQMRENLLVHDMTMTGPLFKLWESIRLNPTKENVSTIIRFMERVTVRNTIEEKFYYENLLNNLG